MATIDDANTLLMRAKGRRKRGRKSRKKKTTTTTTTTTTTATTTEQPPDTAPESTAPASTAATVTAPAVTVATSTPDDEHPTGNGGGHEDFADPLFYINTTPVEGSPETPGRVPSDKAFDMKFVNDKLEMPDGEDIEFWTFENQFVDAEAIYPGSLIRASEGDIVHVTVHPSKRQHTIHLHGIEADTHNDGVGHTSFEVTGHYTYQFRAGAPYRAMTDPTPQTRGAGTYMYHCHVNTTLHFHMGMWGPLIIDPASGPGTAFHNGPTYDVDAERYWASGDVDPVWHELGHAAGMEGEDVGLNDFNPKYFHISGKFQPMVGGKTDPNGVIDDPGVATQGTLGGEPILIRWANAAYARQRIIFEGLSNGSLDIDVIASDGRAFDNQAPNFAKPFALNGPLESSCAERYDLLITPKQKGVSHVTIENLHWITGEVLGVMRTTITVV